MMFDFKERLAWSKGTRQRTDIETIKAMIDGCVRVDIADEHLDRRGIDYVATFRGGGQARIDAKARDRGASRYWSKDMPDLALEDWSVMPKDGRPGKVGWTLDESKQTDLVLFTFDPSDTDKCYLVSFQLLRMAFRRNRDTWLKRYKDASQKNNGWYSHCIFVPVRTVLLAITQASCGRLKTPDSTHAQTLAACAAR